MTDVLNLRLFATDDRLKIERTITNLTTHIRDETPVVVGSVAMSHVTGQLARPRRLNDIDMCIDSIDAVSPSISEDFAIGHSHWEDASKRRPYLAMIDRKTLLKVDLFCPETPVHAASHALVGKSIVGLIGPEQIFVSNVISIELQIARGRIKRQRVNDIDAISPFVRPAVAETEWRQVRRRKDSVFDALSSALAELEIKPELFVVDEFPKSRNEGCPNCIDIEGLPRASHAEVAQMLNSGATNQPEMDPTSD